MRLVAIVIIAAFSMVGFQEKATGEPPVPSSSARLEPRDSTLERRATTKEDMAGPAMLQVLSCMEPVKDFGVVEEGKQNAGEPYWRA
ncbi:MAG TPA: hypothetical protein PKX17_06870, partial [Candidatus Methanomethylicus sp.]|nr:hypothetical protein [Candidatus Methanomethylicus sp.]